MSSSLSRLTLVPFQSIHVAAFAKGRAALRALLQLTVSEDFPVFPESFTFWSAPGAPTPEQLAPWGQYFFCDPSLGELVGDGGFQGPPNEEGEVEIGYAVVPELRLRGYGTEAASALVKLAFADETVRAVLAHTLEDGDESIAILRRLGFLREGTFDTEEDGTVVRWRLGRAS